jgi:hypothetical protein
MDRFVESQDFQKILTAFLFDINIQHNETQHKGVICEKVLANIKTL